MVLTRGDTLDVFSGAYDLFLVGAGVTIEPGIDGSLKPAPRCTALLTPGDSGIEALTIPAQWVVSYGMAVRDSLTVSSLEPDRAVLALQRELPTLSGLVLEQQELPLPIPPGTGAAGVMALYGALLILNVPPERLV